MMKSPSAMSKSPNAMTKSASGGCCRSLAAKLAGFQHLCLERLQSHVNVQSQDDPYQVGELVSTVLRALYISFQASSPSAIKSMDQMRPVSYTHLTLPTKRIV
eukprot:TRINITY_DN56053_c0_g1_i1.p1 TRINITY_DN56053_c0_g1~~TRINITY_DN56053_c0_g1_i1.p1  ORF type:complete len:103 (+),score=23.67 TRINITY_DN56053_c0_g1_i1:69-377(+)